MNYFGNDYWNKATDNVNKTIIPLDTKDVERLTKLMDERGINYYGFSQGDLSKIAINTSDLPWFKKMVGERLADKILYQQPAKPYSPPEKNIIGNVEYKYIPNKKYFKADTDTILKMAEIMDSEGIRFSGRIYRDSSKLTVSGDDLKELEKIKNRLDSIRSGGILSFSEKDNNRVNEIYNDIAVKTSISRNKNKSKTLTIGNIKSSEIKNREYYRPNITYSDFKEIKAFFDDLAPSYSAAIDLTRDKITFCADYKDIQSLVSAFHTARNQHSISIGLIELGISNEQIAVLVPAIQIAAKNGVSNLNQWINIEDSIDALTEMSNKLCELYSQVEAERILRSNELFQNLSALRKRMDNDIILNKIYSVHNFSSEQQFLIRKGLEQGISEIALLEIDDRFTYNEITKYFDLYNKALNGQAEAEDVTDYLNNVRLFHEGVIDDPTEQLHEVKAEYYEGLSDVDKFSHNGSSIYWKYFNEDGNEGNGQIVELTISEYDIQEAVKVMDAAGGRTDNGYMAFIDYIEQNCNQTNSTEENFEAERDSFTNGEYDLTVKMTDSEHHQKIADYMVNTMYLNKAINLINDFCVDEYNSEADLSDLSKVAIAYTTTEDEDHEINVYANLEAFTIEYQLDKNVYKTEKYADIRDMVENGLMGLSFDEMVSISADELESILKNRDSNEEKVDKYDENEQKELEIIWEPMEDMADENGKVDVFYTKVNGTIFWLEPTESGYAITMVYGDGSIQPVSGEYSDFGSRWEAEDYFYEDFDNIKEIAKSMSKANDEKVDTYINSSEKDDYYRIYQLPAGEKYHGIRFTSKETLDNEGVQLSQDDYKMVYEGNWEDISGSSAEMKLQNIFAKFNTDHPEDFKGHSLSVSDVITVGNENGYTAYYVDSFGFKEMPEFFKKELELTEEIIDADPDVPEQLSMFGDSEPITEKLENFKIKDDTLGEGGAKSKFKLNVDAIKTLKQLEADNRAATIDEKVILSKYVGWGGLANAFNPENEKWKNEYSGLKKLLTESEYISARSSVLDSFYTSPLIIDSIYAALEKMGFEGGNILEPACGVGNFLGRLPENIAKSSKIYATEIDSISGRIAQKLYPNAEIKIEGFEKNKYQDDCFDVAVGNVPFGDLSFRDNKYNTSKLHDYFFLESLDKVKNGGIVAFVTSSGTLDKADESIRRKLSEKADLLGAIRLPNTAFKANAGTEVTADIIFLQKNTNRPLIADMTVPDWVHIGQTEDGLSINKYFEQHPEMVLGKMVAGNKLYGREDDTMCIPIEGADIKELLENAVNRLSGEISDVKAASVYPEKKPGEITPPDDLRNYSLFEYENKIYFKTAEDVFDFRYDKTNKQHKKAKAFIELRDCTRELLTAQEDNRSDNVIKDLQTKLNELYDVFYAKYGLINSAANKRAFREDISYNLVATLEKEFSEDKLISKSDIFTKRTIMPAKAIDHVDSPTEALALSMAEKAFVDFEYMEKLTDKTKDQLISELRGEIYEIPFSDGQYQTASEYLSGDIRQKLQTAEAAENTDNRFKENISALEAALPEPLKAGDIDVKIGATWVDPKYYEQFMYETFGTPYDKRSDTTSRSFWRKPQKIEVEYSKYTNQYNITNKRADRSISVSKTYGTDKINAYEIMECLLNLKDPKITKAVIDDDGKEKRVVDVEATKIAQKKADKIRSAFKDWIFDKQERREELVKIYNELFNSIRPREYDGSHLRFPQMNTDITLQEHQKNAVAHALFGGNTLFAHSVGAGKTFEMIASAMEAKRLGLCTKTLMCVPNHLTEQIGADFMKLYPSANVLVATKNDFTKNNRQQLFSKIATGNYDAVIIGHSQLKMIPMNKERQEKLLQSQIDDITEGIQTYKNKFEDKSFNVKSMERTRKSLQKNLDDLKAKKQDDVITFEEMGIDKLIVDEAHEFKNLFTPTKMQNVSGISSSASQKSLDLFLKCQYLDEKTGGKGIILATGTPLSNSVTELHTMMRFLEYDFLKSKDLQHFDNWISVFGTQKTDWELAPAGNKFKQRTRIAEFSGLPELMSMFKQVADVRTADTLNLNVPDCETHIVNVEATEFQKTLVQELADRADDVQDGKVDPSIDNMLRITSDGRKLGLDPRLIDPSFEDDPGTKLNQCVNNVFDIYKNTEKDRLTQIIFCDLGVPHKITSEKEDIDEKSVSEQNSLEEECDFCVYNDIRDKLIAKGVPANEIAYIHDAKTEKQKSDLFEKVRSGEIRVLLGSTPKMGTGTNVQDKLIAVHDLDIPWRPADLEQRKGRIVRQGNTNDKVHLYRYVTKGTFDAYSYQTLENKQKFISQIMTSKTPVRRCEDVDQQALSYAEIKTLCTGDERIKEKMQLDSEVKGLQIERAEYINTKHDMEDKITHAPKQEDNYLSLISNLKKDQEHLTEFPETPEFKLVINGVTYGNEDRTEAAKAFEKAFFNAVNRNPDKSVKIGEFQGMELKASSISLNGTTILSASLQGAACHKIDIGASFANNIKRLESALNGIDQRIDSINSKLNELRIDVAEAQKIIATPFAHEDELKTKSKRLEHLTEELNKAAMEIKENNKGKQRTNYFDVAKLKKEAIKCRNAAEKGPNKAKKNEKTANGIEA